MRIARNTSLQIDDPKASTKRRFGRVRCDGLRCFFTDRDNHEAQVVDFSVGGLRLRLPRTIGIKGGDVVRVGLFSAAGNVGLVVRVMWVRRSGFRRVELGVTFGEPSDQLRRILAPIMRATADNHVVYQDALKAA